MDSDRRICRSASEIGLLMTDGGGAQALFPFAVDTAGVARATYELECLSDGEANQRAEAYLEAHENRG
jgi:hypothetical protein